MSEAELVDQADAVITLGGDATMLLSLLDLPFLPEEMRDLLPAAVLSR